MTGLADARRQLVLDRILEAAWALAERDGLLAWTLRDLAGEVGMKAPSLYNHVDGKDGVYDAMFAQGWVQLSEVLTAVDPSDDPHDSLVAGTEAFVDFCTASVPRYQLMFTHALGDWEPSPQGYASSRRAHEQMVAHLGDVGVTDEGLVDLYTALGHGLVAQQLANDRDGDRWRRLVPTAVAMFLDHVRRTTAGDRHGAAT